MNIVLTGGGATLRHIKELAQFTLQKPTRIGIPEIGFTTLPSDLRHPMYATGLGLLKHGIMEKNSSGNNQQMSMPPIEEDIPTKGVFKQVKNYFNNLLNNFSEKID